MRQSRDALTPPPLWRAGYFLLTLVMLGFLKDYLPSAMSDSEVWVVEGTVTFDDEGGWLNEQYLTFNAGYPSVVNFSEVDGGFEIRLLRRFNQETGKLEFPKLMIEGGEHYMSPLVNLELEEGRSDNDKKIMLANPIVLQNVGTYDSGGADELQPIPTRGGPSE